MLTMLITPIRLTGRILTFSSALVRRHRTRTGLAGVPERSRMMNDRDGDVLKGRKSEVTLWEPTGHSEKSYQLKADRQ